MKYPWKKAMTGIDTTRCEMPLEKLIGIFENLMIPIFTHERDFSRLLYIHERGKVYVIIQYGPTCCYNVLDKIHRLTLKFYPGTSNMADIFHSKAEKRLKIYTCVHIKPYLVGFFIANS